MTQLDIYNAIMERLLATDEALRTPVKSVDWFNDQPDKLEANEAQIAGYKMPTALVRFEAGTWQALGRKVYMVDCMVYVDVMQPAINALANDAPPAERQRAYTQADNVLAIATALNGLRGNSTNNTGCWSSFKLVMCDLDHAYRKIRVDTIAFQSQLKTTLDPREWQKVTPRLRDTYDLVDAVPVDHTPDGPGDDDDGA